MKRVTYSGSPHQGHQADRADAPHRAAVKAAAGQCPWPNIVEIEYLICQTILKLNARCEILSLTGKADQTKSGPA